MFVSIDVCLSIFLDIKIIISLAIKLIKKLDTWMNPYLKNRQQIGFSDFSGVRRQQPMWQKEWSLTRYF